jgi:hypothetical protein
VKKPLATFSALLGLGLLSLGFHGTFSQHVPPRLNAASRTDAGILKLHSRAGAGGCVDLKAYDEAAPRSESFFDAKQNAPFSLRSSPVFPFRFRMILALKIPRYIFNSVLNI